MRRKLLKISGPVICEELVNKYGILKRSLNIEIGYNMKNNFQQGTLITRYDEMMFMNAFYASNSIPTIVKNNKH